MQRTLLLFLIFMSACQLDGQAPEPDRRTTATPSVSGNLADGTVLIRFAAYEHQRPLYEPLIERFNTEQPEIRVQFIPLDQFIYAAGGQPATFDQMARQVVSHADTALINFASPDQIANGYFYNLTPFIDADPSFQRDDFFPGALAALAQDDQVYLIPHTIRLELLAYNKDLWVAQGLPAPQPEWTWADIIAASQRLVQRRGDTIARYGLLDLGGAMTLQAELERLQIPLDTPALRLDHPALEAALSNVVELMREGALLIQSAPQPGHAGSPDALYTLIRDQRIGLGPSSSFAAAATPAPLPFEIGWIPLPDSFLPIFGAAPEGYIMSSGTQHPQAVWRWLAFVSHQLTTPVAAHVASARMSLADQSGFWAQFDDATAAQLRAVIEQSVAHGERATLNNQARAALRDALLAIGSGQASVPEALRAAQTTYAEQLVAAQQTPRPTPDRNPIVVAPPVPAAGTAAQTTIAFYTPQSEVDPMRELAQTFHAQHPEIFIRIEGYDAAAAVATVAARADCFAWDGRSTPTDGDAMVDLQPLIDADAAFADDDYAPWVLARFQRDGRLTGLPYAIMFRVLMYQPALFDRAQIAYPSAPWNFDAFAGVAQQLTNRTGVQTATYGFAPLDMPKDLRFFLDQLGATLFRNNTGVIAASFTAPQTQASIRRYVDLLTTSAPPVESDSISNTISQNFQIILAGRAAMWLSIGIPSQSGYDFPIAAVAPPLSPDRPISRDMPLLSLHLSAQSQHPQACWEWVKHLSATPLPRPLWSPARRSLAQADGAISPIYRAYEEADNQAPHAEITTAPPPQSQTTYFWLQRAVNRAANGADLDHEVNEAQTMTQQFLACLDTGTAAEACAAQVDPTYQGDAP
ncbi:MAG: extracellular solute-binding protein [Chloroflexales bacterium]|nr:extracellular solute-binding protein [Chloroflexales bacterium]